MPHSAAGCIQPLPTCKFPPAPHHTPPQIPLHVFSYKDLYGWTMDEIVAAVGTKSNCTFCGVFRRQVGRPRNGQAVLVAFALHCVNACGCACAPSRRGLLHSVPTSACPATQALDRGAALVGADKIVTGHNADDVAETVLLNILRGDVPR